MTATVLSLLQPLKDRLAAATPGPWNVDRNYPFTSDLVGIFAPNAEKYVLQVESQDDVDDPTSASDAAFIAHAPTDQAKLIAAVELVEKEVAWWEQQFTTSNTQDVAMRAAAYKIRAALTQALGGDTA